MLAITQFLPFYMAALACDSNPCQHEGACTINESEDGYVCNCNAGFSGTNCEIGKAFL